MHRLPLLLSLIAALAATPLRQAEAADDLARSVAESGDDGNVEAPDGGVGDDSDAAIRAANVDAQGTQAAPRDTTAEGFDFAAASAWYAAASGATRSPPAAPSPQRRLALLQRLRC